MPVMDGYESSFRIKSFDPKAKILVLTGNPGDSRASKIVKDAFALTVLEKPESDDQGKSSGLFVILLAYNNPILLS